MRARIDISEVEARTKIRAKYLRAIENEEWGLLPGPDYVKSFLRTYARLPRARRRALVDEYKRRYERPADSEPAADRARAASASAARAAAAAAALGGRRARAGGGGRARCSSSARSGEQRRRRRRRPPRRRSQSTSPTTGAHARRTKHQAQPAPPKRRVTLQLVPTGPVYVCLVDGARASADRRADLRRRPDDPTESRQAASLTLGNARCR